jgi:hypothetical protein
MAKTKLIILIFIATMIIIAAILLIWRLTKDDDAVSLAPKTPAEIMEEQLRKKISEHDLSKPDFELIEKIKTAEQQGIFIVRELINSKNKKDRYLGYVSISGLILQNPQRKAELLPVLEKGLNDSDASIRVQTAQVLLNLGEKQGFPVLINELNSEKTMIPSEPIMTISDYSHLILVEYTGVDYEKDGQRWQNWWNEKKDVLIWNEKNKKFEIK